MGFFDDDNMSWADFDGSGDIDPVENFLGLEILEDKEDVGENTDPDFDDDYDADDDDDYDDEDDHITLNLEIGVSIDLGDDEEDEKIAAEAQELIASENCPTALRYFSSEEGKFLFAKAIKENFDVPCDLPEETDKSKITPAKILKKIAKHDLELTVSVWEWCIKEFMPYKKYEPFIDELLTEDILDEMYGGTYTHDFRFLVVKHMSDNPDFCKTVMQNGEYYDYGAAYLTGAALKEKLYETADTIFGIYLERAKADYTMLKELTDRVLFWCEDNEDVQSVEYFKSHMLPLVKEANPEVYECEIEEWEDSISEHMEEMSEESQSDIPLEGLEELNEISKLDDVKNFKWVGPCEFEMTVSAEDEDDLERKLKEMFGDAIERCDRRNRRKNK